MNSPQIRTLPIRVRQFAKQFQHCTVAALALLSICPSRALAQVGHSHATIPQPNQATPDQRRKQGALLKIVRDSTARFQDVNEAVYEGYALQFGCVSGPDAGAMGLHFVNGALLDEVNKNGVFDPARPQIVIYEPTPSGRPKLTGADYIVFADNWNSDPKHKGPPELMGQLFHLFEAPNRFGLPAFYTLHVWAWKDNPNGAFVNWHPDVRCEQFAGEN
jgi:hypothetical protein